MQVNEHKERDTLMYKSVMLRLIITIAIMGLAFSGTWRFKQVHDCSILP